MATELGLTEAVAMMREILADLPDGEWEQSRMEGDVPPKDIEEVVELVAECYREAPESVVANGVFIPDLGDDGSWACHTGNGPNGAAMARFIAVARNWMPQFLDHIEDATQAAAPGKARKG